ncbi:MAG: hypothetical protein FJ030_09640 [Chloroflexi bacterium]|nr:hypothetical protein [Chloroflexota bacterium]
MKVERMRITLIVVSILAALFLLGWIGLQVKPKPFAMPSLPPSDASTLLSAGAKTVPLPGGLPARFVITHNTGRDYRHYFELAWFGLPVMKVNESYVNGESYFELPVATYENDPNINFTTGQFLVQARMNLG